VDKVEIIIADAGSSGKKLEIAGTEPVNTRGAKEQAFNNELYYSTGCFKTPKFADFIPYFLNWILYLLQGRRNRLE